MYIFCNNKFVCAGFANYSFFSYEIVYKQAVSTEDVFLGMGNKTPTTAGCEDIVVSNCTMLLLLLLPLLPD